MFSLWSVHGLYNSELRGQWPVRGWWLVSNDKGCHKSWLQSWSRGLQSKRRDSVVVSCKGVCTVIMCVWSNKSSCQSNSSYIVATLYARQYISGNLQVHWFRLQCLVIHSSLFTIPSFKLLLDSMVLWEPWSLLQQITIHLYYLPFASISSLISLISHSLHLPAISVWAFPLSSAFWPSLKKLSYSFLAWSILNTCPNHSNLHFKYLLSDQHFI
jgi:hypothetical protein